MAEQERRPSFPPGSVGRVLTAVLVSVATLGGAGGGLAALWREFRGDDLKDVSRELQRLSGAQERTQSAIEELRERQIALQSLVQAREEARLEQLEKARSHLRQPPKPDVRGALDVLSE